MSLLKLCTHFEWIAYVTKDLNALRLIFMQIFNRCTVQDRIVLTSWVGHAGRKFGRGFQKRQGTSGFRDVGLSAFTIITDAVVGKASRPKIVLNDFVDTVAVCQ